MYSPFHALLFFGAFFVGVSEILQLLNQMIFIPLKYEPELARLKGISSLPGIALREDRLSFFVVYAGEYIGIILLVAASLLNINFGFVPLPIWAVSIGIVVIIIGEFFRLWATYTLGKSFTYFVVTTKGQKLVKKGPYRFIRHPGYLGGLLIIAGFGIVSQSVALAILCIVFLSVAYTYRIKVEESALLKRFGKGYVEYSKRTARIIPYII